jgi:hypothetical protein
MGSERKGRGPSVHNQDKTQLGKKIATVLVLEVFEYWKEKMGKKRAVLDKNRHRDIAWGIAVYNVEQCKQAIDGCASSPWHMGDNRARTAYNDVTLIFRDSVHVERFLDLCDKSNEKSAKDKWLDDKD